MTGKSLTRREFIESTAVAAAVPWATIIPRSVKGANEKIELGVIGCGSRGRNALMTDVHRFDIDENVTITAVCDVWNQQRAEAVKMTQDWYGQAAREFVDYRDVLALPNIDAVLIAAPDHLHCTILKAAALAGKDAYCEKPLARNLEELTAAVDAVKKNNRIVQVGTQLRSMASFTGCRKAVRDGALGSIIKAEQVRNSYKPYWHEYARPIQESDTNWDLFLGPAEKQPFDADKHSAWYGFRDFSDGPIGGFMSHFIDLVHYITGAKFPRGAVTLGGIYAWKDQRTCPDSVHTLLEYPEGFMVSYSTMFGNGGGNVFRFYGTKGFIDATEWSSPYITGEGCGAPDRVPEKQPVEEVPVPAHMQNFLQCLRSRNQPNANIDAGYQHAVAVILSDRALVEKRRMMYEPETRRIVPA
ncbi:MAG TPA: Gfo/Idh/MocA family oxidoreductase [bacterium]|nr:Gfo/Idh/MocA family oxidoreductase [bacterium]